MPLATKNSRYDGVIPWRFEYKYQLTRQKYYLVRNSLYPYLKADRFTGNGEDSTYLVRSLYFDNDQFQAYYEKIEGYFGRIKCRIRTYNRTLVQDTVLKAELKNRWGESIEKYSTAISPSAYRMFMATGHWPDHYNPVLEEFERICFLRAMKPKVLVEYMREGYTARDGEDVRVTFDHSVKSCFTDRLFSEPLIMRPHHFDRVVLEIKCRRNQPRWLSFIVRQQGLKYLANSKYTQGVETVRPDLLSPY